MYKHILIATDGSALAQKGLIHGLDLAKVLSARVTIVTVTELWSPFEISKETRQGHRNPIEDYEREAAAFAERVLAAASELAQGRGVAAETVHVTDQHPADGIVGLASQKGCDLIVMASHGRRGVRRMMLGSQALEVMTHTEIPTLIVR